MVYYRSRVVGTVKSVRAGCSMYTKALMYRCTNYGDKNNIKLFTYAS
jgi:hypothetical protein